MNLVEYAQAFGMSCREFVAFAERNRALFVHWAILGSLGAIARVNRWRAAGEPAPDFRRLVFVGDDGERMGLHDLLRRLPAAIAYHCTEFVCFLEVGASAGGWMGFVPATRNPPGDSAHLIVVDGSADPAARSHTWAHEISHAWHRIILPPAEEPRRAPPLIKGWFVERILAGGDASELARAAWREEVLADETASALGFYPTGHSSDIHRLRDFEAELADAAELAGKIERDRIAAKRNIPNAASPARKKIDP